MTTEPDPGDAVERLSETLLLTAGAGVASAGLISILASADAFAARLLAANAQANGMAALHMRQLIGTLTTDLAKAPMGLATATATDIRAAEAALRQPGAPVVT